MGKSFETTKFHWMSWIGALVRYIREDDVEAAANVLACCLGDVESGPGADETEMDVVWRRKMFQHKELDGRHKELWTAMRPLIVTAYQKATEKKLRGQFSWSI
ncbi:MAG: hypothetical protein AAB463_01895 [Patescibacteria group bacterium]